MEGRKGGKLNALKKNRDHGLRALGDKMVVNHLYVVSGSIDIAIVSYTLSQYTVAISSFNFTTNFDVEESSMTFSYDTIDRVNRCFLLSMAWSRLYVRWPMT